jgi:hypothetical protein
MGESVSTTQALRKTTISTKPSLFGDRLSANGTKGLTGGLAEKLMVLKRTRKMTLMRPARTASKCWQVC